LKIKGYDQSFSVKPKQRKGKFVVFNHGFEVKPKPGGTVIKKIQLNRVLKFDSDTGVILKKQIFTRILKQWD